MYVIVQQQKKKVCVRVVENPTQKTKVTKKKIKPQSRRYLQHIIMDFYPEYFILKIPTNNKEMDKNFFQSNPIEK